MYIGIFFNPLLTYSTQYHKFFMTYIGIFFVTILSLLFYNDRAKNGAIIYNFTLLSLSLSLSLSQLDFAKEQHNNYAD